MGPTFSLLGGSSGLVSFFPLPQGAGVSCLWQELRSYGWVLALSHAVGASPDAEGGQGPRCAL